MTALLLALAMFAAVLATGLLCKHLDRKDQR